MIELYAIVRAGSGELLWAGLATAEEAQERAVVTAVNHGNINLLSGLDLAAHITSHQLKVEPPIVEILHERDLDTVCSVMVYLNGVAVPVPSMMTADIDPGAGYTQEDWRANRNATANDDRMTTPFRDAVVAALDEAEGSEYIVDQGLCVIPGCMFEPRDYSEYCYEHRGES